MEAFAARGLVEDGKHTSVDSLDELWAQEVPPVPVEGGAIGGRMVDLQARFNLNNLIDGSDAVDGVMVDGLQAILDQVNQANSEFSLSPFLANRVVDWIDRNVQSSADGAEDILYLGKPLPYRTANGLMSSPTELAAVDGFSIPAVLVLSEGLPPPSDTQPGLPPLVATLPEFTKVNVNTAPAIVLMSLHKDITRSIADSMVELSVPAST